ncbi:hypothetical protein [Hydrogenophaga sp. 5NK40-0174]|uniref:hypothetical protein n=1 Tax=Hydrogenophaga sp. 5NK40-0174 TaxID=3127649 RepID=UPI00310C28EA
MTKWLDRFSARHEFDRQQFRNPSVGALLFVAVIVVLQMLVGIFVRWDAFAPSWWLEGVYDFLLHRNLQLICLSEKTWAFNGVEYL